MKMKKCNFCSHESELLFSHLTHDIDRLCMECYLKLHGSCGVCSTSFFPTEVKPNLNYQVRAKFIGMGEKSIVVCDQCYEAIRQKFSQMFG
jgi:hypothetical protein